MRDTMQGKVGLHFDLPIQKYYGKYGGFFVPDPFTPALDALAEDLAKAAAGPELPHVLDEALQLMGLESLSLKQPETYGKSKGYVIRSDVQKFLAAGYAALGKVLERHLACGVRDRQVALAFAGLVKPLGLNASVWLDRNLGSDASLVKELQANGLEVDLEKTRSLFDDPDMYAFQFYIADPQANLFAPLAANVGPCPFPGISAGFAALFGQMLQAAVDATPGVMPMAYVSPGIPGTEMIGILRAAKHNARLITYEVPWDTEREDCYCGAFTKVVQKGSQEKVLSPELVAAWEAGTVQRMQARDARTALQNLDFSGDVILIEEH